MQTSDGPYQYTIGTMARVARFKGAGQASEQTIQRSGQRPQRIRARTGAASIRPGRAGTTSAAGCLPAVSAPDGYGMILIERRVDLEDATYRVFWWAWVLDGLRA
jgi:hypothetical protein